jgi:hypothetical protein
VLSRPVILLALTWLVETSAATVQLDAEKRKRWMVLPEEPDDDDPLVELIG